jgi:predicted nuclease of predicted toxin-antitoxin system
MRFLIDADLPRDTSALLASFNYTSIDVRDIGMRHADDSEIATHARQNNSCILSGDWGFSDIRAYPPEQYNGIVVIGLPAHSTRPAILAAIRVLLDRPDIVALLPGRLAIVEKNRIRLRPPP